MKLYCILVRMNVLGIFSIFCNNILFGYSYAFQIFKPICWNFNNAKIKVPPIDEYTSDEKILVVPKIYCGDDSDNGILFLSKP